MTKEEFDFQRRLLEQIETLNATVAAQAKTIEQLSHTIAELREQINKNSQTSSKLPSSDGLKKPKTKSLRESSGKNPGGQDGHQGNNLSKFATVTESIPHMPVACTGCSHYEMCKGKACVAKRRQVVDINVEVKVTEHQALKVDVAMRDCWASYWGYKDATYAICCAHLLRELTGIFENHPDQQWASDFMKLLLKMKKTKEKLIAKGKECMSTYYKNKFSLQYQELIEQGKNANPLPETTKKKRGRKKKGKILALIERLDEHKASVCLFANDFSVPFDNN